MHIYAVIPYHSIYAAENIPICVIPHIYNIFSIATDTYKRVGIHESTKC